MQNKPYHHGDLRNKLIEMGIAIINEEGINNFSLRKVAKKVGVSPTACYNHFLNKEELLESMKAYASDRFANALLEAAANVPEEQRILEVGTAYVKFFAENPNYFLFIYGSDGYFIELKQDEFVGDYKAFCVFREVALKSMEKHNLSEKMQRDNLVAMWAMVQGLASMANMKGFKYDGDWGELARNLLHNKLNLK